MAASRKCFVCLRWCMAPPVSYGIMFSKSFYFTEIRFFFTEIMMYVGKYLNANTMITKLLSDLVPV